MRKVGKTTRKFLEVSFLVIHGINQPIPDQGHPVFPGYKVPH